MFYYFQLNELVKRHAWLTILQFLDYSNSPKLCYDEVHLCAP